jgi:DNA-binding GntR family transcriptional regulator
MRCNHVVTRVLPDTMTVQRDTSVPPSQQIAAILRDRISAGTYPPDTRIPSRLQLASEFSVSPETAAKAVRILRDEGRVKVVPGYGVFVAKEQ